MDEETPQLPNDRFREFRERRGMHRDHYSHHLRRHHHHQQQAHNNVYGVFIQKNNLGVMLLRERRYLDAANCFCQAVKYVNERSVYNHNYFRCNNNNDNNVGSMQNLRQNTNNNDNSNGGNGPCHGRSQSPRMTRPTAETATTVSTTIPTNNNGNHTDASERMPINTGNATSDPEALISLRNSGQPSDETNNNVNTIDSFYLLLDENTPNNNGNGNNNNNNNNNTDGLHGRPSLKRKHDDGRRSCPGCCSDKRNDVFSDSSSHHGETYVFRNPIIVSERRATAAAVETTTTTWTPPDNENGSRPASGTRTRRDTDTNDQSAGGSGPPNHYTTTADNGSAPATPAEGLVSPGGPRATAATGNSSSSYSNITIDRGSCAKLSLISVYNMALTYHLAALDSDQKRHDESCPRHHRNNNNNNNEHRGAAGAGSGTAGAAGANPCDESTSRHAKKRRRLSCGKRGDDPYQHDESNNNHCSSFKNNSNNPIPPTQKTRAPKSSSSNNNDDDNVPVDGSLLNQALAYYEIAYRIVVSESKVVVSHAMVILNNIGHIHRLMGKEEKAKACFQRLVITMIYLQQTGNSHQIIHWDFFLKNVIDLIVPSSSKKFAPAA